MFFAFHACAMIGAVAVFLNPRYKAHELSYVLAQSDATTLLLADHLGATDCLEILGEVLPGLAHAEPGALEIEGFPWLRRVVVDADDPYAGCLRLADVLDAGADPALDAALGRARTRVGPDDPMAILYTSGTTAFPKGAVILHRNADVPRTPGPHGDKVQKHRLRELYLAETRTGP